MASETNNGSAVDGLIAKARSAMEGWAGADQETIDAAVTAVAWSLYQPENARALAELAVQDTGLGNVEDKVIKNQRKTMGTLRDLLRQPSVGIIEDDPARGLVRYAKPVGVVAAITPSTNPAATPINKAMMAIKGGNAVVIAPSPSGWSTTSETVRLARAELAKIGAPEDLIQVLPLPITRETTEELMAAADLIVATGSQNNVRRAYRSGTPAIGVGAGNVPVIIDSTASLDDAAVKIARSKTFDNATSCSSENSLVILDDVFDEAVAALGRAGGHLATDDEAARIVDRLFPDGTLNRHVIAKDYAELRTTFELGGSDDDRFVMVVEPEPGPDRPMAGEKVALVLTVCRAAAELGLRLIELGGDVAVLANGAGLTMATMDAIANLGGSAANFLEIGGDAYTKATPALELVLSQPGVRSLLVNFCGAFARCDVMTAGVLEAWQALQPDLPISFSISGTGQDEARAMVRDQLGIDPHETMRDAVAEAVAAAAAAQPAVDQGSKR